MVVKEGHHPHHQITFFFMLKNSKKHFLYFGIILIKANGNYERRKLDLLGRAKYRVGDGLL